MQAEFIALMQKKVLGKQEIIMSGCRQANRRGE
jgi:hypothetical protein